jgi:hypothetical protein
VYHVELRQFPHSFCRFNMSEQELRDTILSSWARGDWVPAGDRRWSPHQATLTVIEAPQLVGSELALGRGWRNAQRRGRDVTAQLLASVSEDASAEASRDTSAPAPKAVEHALLSASAQTGGGDAHDERKALVDALALELLQLLGEEPVPLARAWLLARERNPSLAPSESLALAEAALRERR